MLPSTFAPGGTSQYEYLITQPMVMVHYMVTFIIPYNLSADTDWTVYTTIFDYRALTGIFIIAGLFYLALKASKNKETRLFSFGILWFFISLLPTSSFIPFSEVLNDHRCFIPYIGLTISFVFGINYLLQKFLYKFYNKQTFKYIIYLGIFVFLTANVYGVRQRNKVWSTELSLWKDVTIKSPMNGRGLMNYGLSLMAKGDFVNAENYFNKSLLLNPNYGILHINLGVVKNAIGNKTEAENHFKKAIILNPNGHTHLYFYSHFLYSEGRLKEAKPLLNRALEISPTYSDAKSLLNTIKINETQNDVPNEINKKIISNAYLNLSLEHYNSGDFLACIEAAQKSNEIIPNCGAFNNICSAYNQLEEYDKAILACNEALKIDKDNNLAKGNLNVAISNSRHK